MLINVETSKIQELSGNKRKIILSNFPPDSIYTFRILAQNSNGNSDWPTYTTWCLGKTKGWRRYNILSSSVMVVEEINQLDISWSVTNGYSKYSLESSLE